MIMFVRTLLTFVFSLSGALVWAADPAIPAPGSPAPAAGSKTAEFAKINKEWTELVASLGALKSEYATSTDAARKAEIRKQYEAGVQKAQGMEGKVVAAAEGAYAEAPNADTNIVDILVATLFEYVNHDDFEPAFRIGKELMDNKCTEKHVAPLAGVAAFCVNDYDLAADWLQAAKTHGNLPKEYDHYLDSVGVTKA